MNRGPERARKFTIIVFCLTEYGYPIGQRELFMIKGHKTSWAVGRRENQLPRRRMKFSRMWAVPVRALKFQAAPWSAAHGPFAMRLHRKTREKERGMQPCPERRSRRILHTTVLRGVPAGRTALYPHLPHQGGGPGRAGGELLCRPAPAGEGLHTGGVADLLAGGGGGPGPGGEHAVRLPQHGTLSCAACPGKDPSGGADAPAYPGLSL